MARKIRGRNEGSIFKLPNGTWRTQISMGDGKRISYTGKTKAEAQEWLRNKFRQIDFGLDIEGGKTTTGEYLQGWLSNAQASLRPKTAFQYGKMVENHLLPYLSKIPLHDLTQQRIECWYREMILDGRGVRTVRYTHSILHKALEKAVMYGLIVRNPAHGADLPRSTQKEMNVWDESQISAFLTAASESRLAVF